MDTNVTRSRVDGIGGQFKLTLDTLLNAEGGELEAHTQVDKILTGRVAAPQDTANITAAKSKLYTVIRWLSPVIAELGNRTPKHILKQALFKAVRDFGYKIGSSAKALIGWVCEWLVAHWLAIEPKLAEAMDLADRSCATIESYRDFMEERGYMSTADNWPDAEWLTLDVLRLGYTLGGRFRHLVAQLQ